MLRFIGVLGICILTMSFMASHAEADPGSDAYRAGNYELARTEWEKNAYSDPFAAYNLGILYETGKGGAPDYKTAFKWYLEAANDARKDELKTLKRQAVFAMGRITITNRDADLISTTGSKLSTLAMKTGDPHALRLRGLLMEFQADHSIENNIRNADNPMRFAYGLLRVAADRGAPLAEEEAKRVFKKVNDKGRAKNNINLVRDELQRNGVGLRQTKPKHKSTPKAPKVTKTKKPSGKKAQNHIDDPDNRSDIQHPEIE
ncbi:MAG: hypothetical protein OQK24_08420 [Magnetovibrio sp.]|nr:hypothetical protein [Magnetovibrio sp.]